MIQQNIHPSLRQSMINEALDYHQNMNSVVFGRTSRNLQEYARESGKTDPSPKDVLVEGTIRQKIGEISTQIQRLNQQLNYAANPVPAPAPIVGSGTTSSKQLTDVINPLMQIQDAPSSTYMPPGTEAEMRQLANARSLPSYLEEDIPDAPGDFERESRIQELRDLQPGEERDNGDGSYSYRTASGSLGIGYYPEGSEGEEYLSEGEIPRGFPGSVSEGSVRSQAPSDFNRSDYTRPTGFPGSSHGDSQPEPIAPGPVFSSSPNASDSSKLHIVVDNSLAAIISGYNNLVEYIELQKQQRAFSQQDEANTSQQLAELVQPLKMLIANAAVAKQGATRDLLDYTRIYNVISALINRIKSSPPFLKVPTGILTEKLPIREDIIQAKNYNPDKASNSAYLEQLVSKIRQEFDFVVRTSPKSPLEKEARELKLKELETAYQKVVKAGYRKSEEVLGDLQGYDEALRQRDTTELIRQDYEEGKELTEDKFAELDGINRRRDEAVGILNNNTRLLEDDFRELTKILRTKGSMSEMRDMILDQREAAASPRANADHHRNVLLLTDNLQELERKVSDIRQGILINATRIENIRADIALADAYLNDHDLTLDQRKELEDTVEESYQDLIENEQAVEKLQGVLNKWDPVKEEDIRGIKKYHTTKALEQRVEGDTRREKLAPVKAKYKGNFPTFLGDGMPSLPKASSDDKPKTGGHVHKKSSDPFGDNSELAPYLTKYLRPSKHRQDVPEVISSSEESSDEDDGVPIKKKVGLGKKKVAKVVEDFEIIVTAPKAEKGFLLAKKTPKRTGGKKKKAETLIATKPVEDLWFM